MGGFQFIHVETYGRSAPKKAAQARWTIRDVIAEVAREPGACPHVADPRPPVLLHGAPPAEVEGDLLDAAEAARDRAGRRLRRDAQLLLAGVASFPLRLGEATDAGRQAFSAWERDTVAWLRAVYGDRLRTVLRHDDEAFGHLHWLASADLGAGERIEALHPGRRAVAEAKAAGVASKSEIDRRYRAAMQRFQDDYHAAVGARHGLTRRGPGRRRLTRAEWQQDRAVAERVGAALQRGDAAVERSAELEHDNAMLAIEAAKEGMSRRLAERERDDWRGAAQRLGAELATERQRAAGLERLLAEAREALATTIAQAKALLRAMLNPTGILLPQCPTWLGRDSWSAIRARFVAGPVGFSGRSRGATAGCRTDAFRAIGER